MNNRLDKLRSIMGEKGIEGLLISSVENRTYFSDFIGDEEAGYLFITQDEEFIVTDSRYTEQAKNQSKFEVIEYKTSSAKVIKELADKYKVKELGFEDQHIVCSKYNKLLQTTETHMIPVEGLVSDIRNIKDTNEIEKIKAACELGDRAFTHILDFVKIGITEKELALELEYYLKKNGAEGLAFDTIVATGARTSLPHARPSDTKVANGDFVLFDFGCKVNNYCSDMTRTVAVGRANEEQKKIYNIVLGAQKRALDFISKGKKGSEVDKVARDYITEKGYGENFGHGLGHGVGLYIHEEPRLSPSYSKELQPGMVVTVEPGIYVEGFGGVRIEDMVVINQSGIQNFMNSPKMLIEL